jgi:hypothetical protein
LGISACFGGICAGYAGSISLVSFEVLGKLKDFDPAAGDFSRMHCAATVPAHQKIQGFSSFARVCF